MSILGVSWAPSALRHEAGGWKHSDETRAKIRATMSDPAKRAAISAATKASMADPAVRQRIKDGMRKAADDRDEIRLLRVAWRASSPGVRRRFLAELQAPLCADERRV